MPKLIKNTVVKVYQDPTTCLKLEGQAKLLTYINTYHEGLDDEREYWTVRFISDGAKVDRFVNLKTH